MKYYDVFGESGHDSAFLTTYAFSAQAFEDVPFPRLRGAGCRNITVLADRGMLNTSFSEFGPPRYAGTMYHVVKVGMPGAFHPKITLLIGARKGRLLIGSANLTALGFGGNRELVADITYSTEAQDHASLFGQALRYIARHVPEDDPWFASAFDRALRHAPWLRAAMAEEAEEPSANLRLLIDRPEDTILDQIAAAIGTDPIERLIVLSPYWDEGLEGLRRLRATMGTPSTDLLLQPSVGQFPVESLGRHDGLGLFNLDMDSSSRFTHAKLFIALGAEWDHVISGSVNCSAPALLGREGAHGNAEAGIYKRVARGVALATLKLSDYEASPLDLADLPLREERGRGSSHVPIAIDAGDFELRGGELLWRRPKTGDVSPVEVQLFDRDDKELLKVIRIEHGTAARWTIDPEINRPRVARVVGDDGVRSAPAPIVDLDILALSTLPVRRGRKRTIVDNLLELDQEDLTILEALNELEMLEVSEQSKSFGASAPRTTTTPSNNAPHSHRVLPYEAFVAARDRARQEHDRHLPWLRGEGDTPASMINACLNRLVGLVSEDLSQHEEQAMLNDAATDLRTTEPAGSGEPGGTESARHEDKRRPTRRARAAATAMKYLEAVVAFEKRTSAFKGERIKTAELVRLRALLQVVLAGAMPISGKPKDHQVLPLISKDSTEWPRLVGRLLRQHFGTIRALQSLDDAEDENDHIQVLDYLATARFAAHAALKGAKASPSLSPIRKALEALAADLNAEVLGITAVDEAGRTRLNDLAEKLDGRFSQYLGLSG